MQEHIQLTPKEINQDLLSGVLGTPKWWLGLVTFLLLVVLAGAGAFGYVVKMAPTRRRWAHGGLLQRKAGSHSR